MCQISAAVNRITLLIYPNCKFQTQSFSIVRENFRVCQISAAVNRTTVLIYSDCRFQIQLFSIVYKNFDMSDLDRNQVESELCQSSRNIFRLQISDSIVLYSQ